MAHSPTRAMRRSPRLHAWLLAALCAPLAAVAQPPTPAAPASPPAALPVPVPRTTGDATLDARLLDIDRYGARYRDAFVDELVRYHRAPRDLVIALLERGWSPGDVYYACALANASGRACRYVANGANGASPDWIAIARRLGITPGSPHFARLGDALEATYGRWGRPLPPEAAVARAPADPRVPIEPPPRTPEKTPVRPPRDATASED